MNEKFGFAYLANIKCCDGKNANKHTNWISNAHVGKFYFYVQLQYYPKKENNTQYSHR